MFKDRLFYGKCAICGKEMSQPAWGPGEFHDVCNKCFDTRFWDIIKEEVRAGNEFIIEGEAFTTGRKGGFGGQHYKLQLLENHPKYNPDGDNIVECPGTLWSNGSVPKERLSEFPDNAKFIWETRSVTDERH